MPLRVASGGPGGHSPPPQLLPSNFCRSFQRSRLPVMMYFSRLKTGLILGVCLLGALLCIPNLMPAPASWLPWRTVHLGLDLRGGSYLLLEVDMDAVVKERLESLTDGVRQDLRPGNIFYQTLRAEPAANRVLLRLRDPARTAEAVAALQALVSPTGRSGAPDIDIATTSSGGTPDGQITLTLNPVGLTDRASSAVQQSIEIIRRRIDETGVIDPQITRQGSSRIVVQLPGIEDPNRIKELLGKTAHMTFRLVDENANPAAGPPPPGVDFLTMEGQPGQKIGVRKRIDVDGADLTDARAGTSGQTGEWVVNFTFNSVGTRRFADISRANVGHRFAIVLDDKVISAPVIREAITAGRGQISGSFNAASANDLSVLLRAGALPAPLTVVEERSVGPELGADSIRVGALSLAFGFVLVIIFMAVFYGHIPLALIARLENISQNPDVVILDYCLNSIDIDTINGIETLDKIRSTNPLIPVIMLSSQDKIEVAVNCMKHMAFDYIVKSETAFIRLQKDITTIFHNQKREKALTWYMDKMSS